MEETLSELGFGSQAAVGTLVKGLKKGTSHQPEGTAMSAAWVQAVAK